MICSLSRRQVSAYVYSTYFQLLKLFLFIWHTLSFTKTLEGVNDDIILKHYGHIEQIDKWKTPMFV